MQHLIFVNKKGKRLMRTMLLLMVVYGCKQEQGQDGSSTDIPGSFNTASSVGPQADGSYVVATSQTIQPAGKTILFPGRPTDLAMNPSETVLAIKNKSDIVLIDLSDNEIEQTLDLPSGGNTYVGIAWSADGKSVWTTDTKGYLRSARMEDSGSMAWDEEILLPGPGEDENSNPYPGGFFIDRPTSLLYVALSRNNTVAVVDPTSKEVVEQIPVGIAPYTVIKAGQKVYVTNWGGRISDANDKTALSSGSSVVIDPETGIASSGTVSVIDLPSRKVVNTIQVQLHPSGMALDTVQHLLYVANANSDLISVIDTRSDKVIREIGSKPAQEMPFGSAPNALTLSPDGKTLYVSNGGNNLLAVIDLDTDKIRGLIPTGWYPGPVIMNKAGDTLFVVNIKGVGGRDRSEDKNGLNSHDHFGSVSIIPVPDDGPLQAYTLKAASNMRLPTILKEMNLKNVPERVVPVPTRPGEKSVFKHVLYIIKENRTYDQLFGDIPQGNGDSTLCQFVREVTPNHHALAEEFVLLDNTYCNGVLSADGHQWTNEGYVTDYLEKSFGGFVRSYPYEGDDPLAFASSGFIWDKALEAGLTFRDYGEFVQAEIDPEEATWTDIYQQYLNGGNAIKIKATTPLHTLEPYLCSTFVGFPGKVQDVYRAQEFIKELAQFEKNDSLPNLMMMLLPNDHTTGTREGYPTPRAAVADNDLALGRIVEAMSHSKFWPETVIFVVEDDPQAGLDHVDGRRTVALCISPYTKRGEVIGTQYNQNSILRTIELVLGLSPMSQFDLLATPMTDCFNDAPDFSPYVALPNQIPLDEMNPKLSSLLSGPQLYFARKSMEMPLDDIDQADEEVFNRIIWHSVKGYDVAYPEPKDEHPSR